VPLWVVRHAQIVDFDTIFIILGPRIRHLPPNPFQIKKCDDLNDALLLVVAVVAAVASPQCTVFHSHDDAHAHDHAHDHWNRHYYSLLMMFVGLAAFSGENTFSEPPGPATWIFPSPMSRLWAGVTMPSHAAAKRSSKRSE
jgi:hypothetical protein